MKFFKRIHELTEFASANRGKAFHGWSDSTIYFYLAFHALCDSLFILNDSKGRVKAIGVATSCPLSEIGSPFDWKKTSMTGDCLMIWEVIGDRKSMQTLFVKAIRKFSNVKRCYAYRLKDKDKPELVNIHWKTLRKFIYG